MTTKTMTRVKKQSRTVELRNATVEDDNGDKILQGYAAVFDTPTYRVEWDGTEYTEIIARGAFDGANFKDCFLKYNHSEDNLVLARYRGGSLQTSVDDFGLKFRAKLFNISLANDVYTLVKEGGIDQMSFAFIVSEDSYNVDTRTRTILKFSDILDLSLVPYPQYEDTNVEARSFFDLERKKEQALDRAKLVDELIVRTYL